MANEDFSIVWFILLLIVMARNTLFLWLNVNFWVGPQKFLELVGKETESIVVFYKRKRFFKTEPYYGYFVCVKGMRFYTKVSEPLSFPGGCELIEIPCWRSWIQLHAVQKPNE